MRFVLAVLACLLAASPAAAADELPRSFVGLYGDDSFYGDSAYRQSQLAAQAALGVGIVRQPLEWQRVERTPGKLDFSDYDGFVADAATAGVSVLPVLIAPPPFRSSRPPDSTSRAMFPPSSNAAYASFAGAAVRRYGPSGSFWRAHPSVPFLPIHAWQVWNEPNIPNFWRSGVNARQYVALLRAASAAIRAADPGAEVVAAGLPNSNLGVPFLDYLDRMYEAGARGLFDTLAIHPYSRGVSGLLGLAERARALMSRWHDRSRLWITEFGWSTGGDASAFRVSERGQADRIASAVSGLYAERHALRLRGFVMFKWKDSVAPAALGADPWPLHTGLLDSDGAPKRGYWVFARMARALRAGYATSAAAPAAAIVARRTVRVSPLGFAPVSLGCQSPEPGACGGVLRLEAARSLTCGGVRIAAGGELGHASFRIAVAPAIAPVRLRAAARRLAACAGRIRVRAATADPGGVQLATGTGARAAGARPVEFDLVDGA